MSQTLNLIENGMTPQEVCVGLYEAIKRAEKLVPSKRDHWGKLLDTDDLRYDTVNRDGVVHLRITVTEHRYCGRSCRCYHDTIDDEYVVGPELLTAFENYLQNCCYAVDLTEESEYMLAAFEILMSQYVEALAGVENDY